VAAGVKAICVPGSMRVKREAVVDHIFHDTVAGFGPFLDRIAPGILVVHGEERSGHRQIARRFQSKLESEGRGLWRPVAEMQWTAAGDVLVHRSQLAGAIARALGVSDQGTQAELENRIAHAMAARCADDRVLVFDVVDIMVPKIKSQTQALLTLTQELWKDLTLKAREYRDNLPAFLLLSVGYPHVTSFLAFDAKSVRKRSLQALAELQKGKLAEARICVGVLDELRAVTAERTAEFLSRRYDMNAEEAARRAAVVMQYGDNERILDEVGRLLRELNSFG